MRKKNLEMRIEDIEDRLDANKTVRFVWEDSECDEGDNNRLHGDDRIIYRIHWRGRNDKGTTMSA